MDGVAAALTLATPPVMATPLLLVVHGRSGGVIPTELQTLASELAHRRGTPVLLQALTAACPDALPQSLALAPGAGDQTLTLVPLMLLPGGHVRQDIPAIAKHWRALPGVGAIRRRPFIGAWPLWQQALAAEAAQLRTAALVRSPRPALLHHPLEGALARRFLDHLAEVSGTHLRATPYSSEHLADLQLTLSAPALPLALAANRLTDSLASLVGPPLLQRARFRQLLLAELEALP
jgi:sirohydrochlorin ferrochelatase